MVPRTSLRRDSTVLTFAHFVHICQPHGEYIPPKKKRAILEAGKTGGGGGIPPLFIFPAVHVLLL